MTRGKFIDSTVPTGSKLNCYKLNQYISYLYKSKVPKEVLSPFVNQIIQYLKCNGPEWTVTRLKDLYTWYLHSVAYGMRPASDYLKKQGFRTSRRGVPKSGFAQICHWMLRVRHKPSLCNLSLAVLRIYTCFISSKTTKKQEQKLLDSIMGRKPDLDMILVQDFEKFVTNRTKRYRDSSSYYYIYEDLRSERFYNFRSLRPFTSTCFQKIKGLEPLQNSNYLEQHSYLGVVLSQLSNPWLPSQVDRDVPSVEIRDIVRDNNLTFSRRNDIRGKISVIQEQGYKARVVAIPNSWLQYYMTSVHQIVRQVTNDLYEEEDCILEQAKGVHAAIDKLSTGTSVYSIDLSSATDNFPLLLQQIVLHSINMPKSASALSEIAEGPWLYVDRDGNSRELSYTKGQPMGMVGSISLFNLTHLLVLDYCTTKVRQKYARVSKFCTGAYFYIIGDDVICSDAKISKFYKQFMLRLGVPLSEHKSFSSRKLTEFAGFIVRSFGKKPRGYRRRVQSRSTHVNWYAPYFVLPLLPYKRSKSKFITNSLTFCNSFNLPPYMSKGFKKLFEAFVHTRALRDITLNPISEQELESRLMDYKPITLAGLQSYLEAISHLSASSNGEFTWPSVSTTQRVVLPEETRDLSYLPVLTKKVENNLVLQRYIAYKSLRSDLLIDQYLKQEYNH